MELTSQLFIVSGVVAVNVDEDKTHKALEKWSVVIRYNLRSGN